MMKVHDFSPLLFGGWMTATLLATTCCAQHTTPRLRDRANPYFGVGVGVGVSITDREDEWELLTSQFEFVTPENCMKVAAIQQEEGEFTFTAADRFVNFATEHNLKIVGHCLVWRKMTVRRHGSFSRARKRRHRSYCCEE